MIKETIRVDNIISIQNLIDELKNSGANQYVSIAKRITISKDECEEYISWDAKDYTRNCIEHNDDFELILICWKPGDETPIHDHNDQRCWVYQIEGEVVEERFVKDEEGNLLKNHEMILSGGRLTYMHDSMGYHTLSNKTNKNAFSLHLYIKPVEKCQIFDEGLNAFKEVEMNYHTIDGKLNLETV